MNDFSHYSENGNSMMVDVSSKEITVRTARAEGFIKMQPATLELIEKRLLPKGNLFEVSRIAGIMAAKKTAEIIPMCHPLNLSFINVDIEFDKSKGGIRVSSEIRMKGVTGAEMEALTAVSAAALTVYDMVKAVDKEMIIDGIRLIEKKGGKSDYNSPKDS
ncbi:MAG: cyclic pyranopterin monophosphate synthase MoaC [Leptospirales bacterium]|nr:cyclic pyranopterin monophosphate synthase MoaC [Leptospirales bacterium]